MTLQLREKFVAILSKDINGDGTIKRCNCDRFSIMTEFDTAQ